jgi:hypothetical protein
MEDFIHGKLELARVLFWGAVAFAVGQAIRQRPAIRRLMRYAPLTAGAAAAYLVGCFVGAALMTYLP